MAQQALVQRFSSRQHTRPSACPALSQARDGRRLFPDAIDAPFHSFVGNATASAALVCSILERAGLSTEPRAMAPVLQLIEEEMGSGVAAGGARAKFQYDLGVFGLTESGLAEHFGADRTEVTPRTI